MPRFALIRRRVLPVVVASLMALFAAGCADRTASDRTTGPSDALEVFGNVNGDDRIDASDAVELERLLARGTRQSEPWPRFADANRDGSIDTADVEQVRRLAEGRASAIWFLDGNGSPVRVPLPLRRIGVEYLSNVELMRILGAEDRVVAVDTGAYLLRHVYFPGRTDLLSLGAMHAAPAFEAILPMDLDVLFTFGREVDAKQRGLPGTAVVFLGLYWPDVLDPGASKFRQGVLKAGYLVGAPERAREYLAWVLGAAEQIRQRTEVVPPSERPSVLMTSYNGYLLDGSTKTASVYTRIDPLSQACLLAGGRPVAARLPGWDGAGAVYATTVGMEWVLEQSPDFIVAHTVHVTYNGVTRRPAYGYAAASSHEMVAAVQAIRAWPLMRDLKAVTTNRVFITAGDFRNNAMGGVLGAAYLARRFHPARFADWDPIRLHEAFVSDWLRLDPAFVRRSVFIAPAE